MKFSGSDNWLFHSIHNIFISFKRLCIQRNRNSILIILFCWCKTNYSSEKTKKSLFLPSLRCLTEIWNGQIWFLMKKENKNFIRNEWYAYDCTQQVFEDLKEDVSKPRDFSLVGKGNCLNLNMRNRGCKTTKSELEVFSYFPWISSKIRRAFGPRVKIFDPAWQKFYRIKKNIFVSIQYNFKFSNFFPKQ